MGIIFSDLRIKVAEINEFTNRVGCMKKSLGINNKLSLQTAEIVP